ncbi:MAG: hypothetical protein ACR2OK_01855, partial [Parvibaculales bacterium]
MAAVDNKQAVAVGSFAVCLVLFHRAVASGDWLIHHSFFNQLVSGFDHAIAGVARFPAKHVAGFITRSKILLADKATQLLQLGIEQAKQSIGSVDCVLFCVLWANETQNVSIL